jgi:hypothetical protein
MRRGVNFPWYQKGPANQTNSLTWVPGMGATWVRIPINWYELEPTPGVYTPAPLDAAMAAYKPVGVKILWCVMNPPTWATGYASHNAIPSNTTDFAAFMAHLVAEYPGSHWELFNEVDNNVQFTPGGIPVVGSHAVIESTLAAAYVPILKAAYAAMKAADPTCVVHTQAISQIVNLAWYNDFVAQGAVGSYDVLSLHLYYSNTPNPITYYGPFLDALAAARVAAGDGVPLWVDEFGFPAAPAPYDPLAEGGIYSQAQQASWIQLLWQGLANRGDVALSMYYTLHDTATTPTGNVPVDQQAFYGLIGADGVPKIAYKDLANIPT